MKLIALSDARDRAGLQDLSSSNVILDSALDTATAQVEAFLRTPLLQAARTDLFFANSDVMPFAIPSAKLLLNAGFVDEGSTFEVRVSRVASDAPTGTLIDPTDYLIDYERGVLLFVGYDPDLMYIHVTYTAGFQLSNGVLQNTPDWLVSLGFMVGVRMYATIRHDDDLKKQFDYMPLMEPKIRYEPAAIRPLL